VNAEVTLLYANRTDDIAFKPLFDGLTDAHPRLHVVYIVSHPSADWRGPVGRIDAEFIGQHVPDLAEAQFFASGPQPMVEAMDRALTQLGVPRERLTRESFPGYSS
jgi:ferredoxin-NADP reductase